MAWKVQPASRLPRHRSQHILAAWLAGIVVKELGKFEEDQACLARLKKLDEHHSFVAALKGRPRDRVLHGGGNRPPPADKIRREERRSMHRWGPPPAPPRPAPSLRSQSLRDM